jgi:small conductance mechanosensitive channel
MNWTPIVSWLASHGVRILIIIVVSAVFYFAMSKAVPSAVKHSMRVRRGLKRREARRAEEELTKRTKTLSDAFMKVVFVFIIAVAIFMILAEVGINITPLIAGLGIAGIAVGFGAQSLVKDLIAGLFILLEDQYNIGDVARIADTTGIVEDINLRRTILRDLDGIVHIVPNGEIRVASNFTKNWSRVNLNISVAYGTDLDHAIAVINRVCDDMAKEAYWKSRLLTTPKVLRVDSLGDSGIDIKILGDTKPIMQWEVMGELRKRLKKAFDDEGIEIPWPHTKVYFGDLPPQMATGQAQMTSTSVEIPPSSAPAKPPPPITEDD